MTRSKGRSGKLIRPLWQAQKGTIILSNGSTHKIDGHGALFRRAVFTSQTKKGEAPFSASPSCLFKNFTWFSFSNENGVQIAYFCKSILCPNLIACATVAATMARTTNVNIMFFLSFKFVILNKSFSFRQCKVTINPLCAQTIFHKTRFYPILYWLTSK